MIDYPHWKLLEEADGHNTKWQVLAYPRITPLNPGDLDVSHTIAAGVDMKEALIASVTPLGNHTYHPIFPVKQVRIGLEDASVILDPGAMLLTKGNIDMNLQSISTQGGVGSFIKKAATSVASGESMIKNIFSGTGEVFLEPREDFVYLVTLKDETLVCDQSLFVACDGSCEVDGLINRLSAALYGGEGLVMPRMKGTGAVLLQSPVPKEKIMEVKLEDETLTVDGSSVMAFWGNIEFTAKRATKGLIRSAASGEGFVNTYTGTGTVWINLEEAGCFKA